MARIKAVFDTDILFHIVKTDFEEQVTAMIDTIYVADYVYNAEIKKGSKEGKYITKLKNTGKITILDYSKLTEIQRRTYLQAYSILKDAPIQEGERITASYAKAFNVSYYMSDDNNAASFIKTKAAVEIVNYCDLLFIYLNLYGKEKVGEAQAYYQSFIQLYEVGKEPRIIKDGRNVLELQRVIHNCHQKFNDSIALMGLLKGIQTNFQQR